MKHLAIRPLAAAFVASLAFGACTEPTGEQGDDENPLGPPSTSRSSEKASFSVSGGSSAQVVAVDPTTLTVSDLITFDTFAPVGSPGTNFDGVLDLVGGAFAERFAGQTLSFSVNFDVLSGAASDPATLQVGDPNDNVSLLEDSGSNVLTGLGPLGFPDGNSIGEGSFAVLFDFDQSEVGFRIVGANPPSTMTINFFTRDGALLETIVAAISGNDAFAFRRVTGVRDIAGFSVHNTDPAGIGYDDFKFDNTSPNQAPVADAGPDQTLDRTSAAGVSVALDGTASSDPDSDPLTFSWTGPFPEDGGTVTGSTPTVSLAALGVNTITLTVDDGNGGTDTDQVQITVNNVAPTANAGADQLLDLVDAAEKAVTLDGFLSDDLDGTIATFEWSTAALAVPATGVSPTVDLPVGVHTIVLEVTDNDGASDTDEVIIEVRFVIPPEGGSAPIEEDGKKRGEVDVGSDAFGEAVVLEFEFVGLPCHNALISQYGRCLSVKFTSLATGLPVNPAALLTYKMCLPAEFLSGVTDPQIIFEFADADAPVIPRQDFDAPGLDCTGFVVVGAEPGNGLMRFARGVVDRVTQFFAPEPLVAAPVVFRGDEGRGWTGLASFFTWAKPIVSQPDAEKFLTGEVFDTDGVIRCKPRSVITVAVLTTLDSNDPFDATTIDENTVFFGPTGMPGEAQEIHRNKKTGVVERHVKLVDDDLEDDMVFHFHFSDTGLACDDDTFARLGGKTLGGDDIVSADFVRLVEKGN